MHILQNSPSTLLPLNIDVGFLWKSNKMRSADDGKEIIVNNALFQSRRFPNNQWGSAKGLCLVNRGSKNQCTFEHAQALLRGKIVPMTLSSHPGAICKQHYPWMEIQKPRKSILGEYIESCGGDNAYAIYVGYCNENYLALYDKDEQGKFTPSSFIIDVSLWNVVPGTAVNFAKVKVSDEDLQNGDYLVAGGGSDWFINASDNTISCKHVPELVLGFESSGRKSWLPEKYQGLKVLKRDYSVRARLTYLINQGYSFSK